MYKTQLINLFIIAISIILICAAKTQFKDLFVANVPNVPIGGMPYGQPYGPQSNLGYNPYQFDRQMYPARLPYYPEYERPCSQGGCGAMGKCENGKCVTIPYDKTVFDVSSSLK